MKSALRALAWRVAPGAMADRARAYELRLRERAGVVDDARAELDAHGEFVRGGPVEGLRYPRHLAERADAPVAKLRGGYEAPIADAISDGIAHLTAEPGSIFADLGTADGYYAVGVARKEPRARVIGFDLSRDARRATAALAAANGADVRLRRRATPKALLQIAADVRFLLCDIEGAEADVLTVEVAAGLAHAHVVVESHDGRAPGTTRTLTAVFSRTHDVERRVVDASSCIEMRSSDLCWLVCRPRN